VSEELIEPFFKIGFMMFIETFLGIDCRIIGADFINAFTRRIVLVLPLHG